MEGVCPVTGPAMISRKAVKAAAMVVWFVARIETGLRLGGVDARGAHVHQQSIKCQCDLRASPSFLVCRPAGVRTGVAAVTLRSQCAYVTCRYSRNADASPHARGLDRTSECCISSALGFRRRWETNQLRNVHGGLKDVTCVTTKQEERKT